MNKCWWRRIKYLVLGILGCLLVLLLWGLIEPYQLKRENVTANIPALPQSWQGKEIMVISDFQFGMWMANRSTVTQAVDQIVAERPAAALITGDFVYKPKESLAPELNRVLERVRPLVTAQIPTYAVLGNHDYSDQNDADSQQRATQIRQGLESIGVRVLQNEAISLPTSTQTSANENLYLVGIGAYRPNQSQPLEAFAQVPNNAARFVMMHNPASFADIPAGKAPVAVAGHTHGGQIRLPFLPQWSWMTLVEDKANWSWISKIKGDTVRVAGWIPGYGNPGNRLYINRGIGFSKVPIRFHCQPELTVFTLQLEA